MAGTPGSGGPRRHNPGPGADELLDVYDAQTRGSAETANLPEGAWAERDGPVVRIVGQFRGFVSGPRHLGVGGAELDALIARQRDYFAARGEAVEWKTRAHDTPVNIPDRLLAAGFRPEARETVLIGPAETLAAIDATLPDGVTIRSTVADDDMRRIAALESRIWDDDLTWMGADLMARLRARPDQLAVFVAEAGDEMVAAAWLAMKEPSEVAGLWGGSTAAPWRGRGIYRALVAGRARLAVDRGVRYLQVDASDDSRPILERLGLVPITTTTPYVWTPPGDAPGDGASSSG